MLNSDNVSGGSPDAYAALRHRDFRLYFLGALFGAIGGQMQSVAVGWELYERTNSAMSLGLVGLVQAVPVILLAIPAGHLADRYNRRKIVIVAQACSVLCSLGLAALSYQSGRVEFFYLILLLAATVHAVAGPAGSALLPQLVPINVFSNAVTWNSTRWQIAATTGPAVGGMVIAMNNSATAVYMIDAIAAGLFLSVLLAIKGGKQERAGEKITLQSLLAGIAFVRKTTLIAATITLDMVAVLLGGAVTLLPVFAKDILYVGPSGLGWLRAAPALGALGMALLLAHSGQRGPLRNAGRSLLWSVAGFGAATIVFGLSQNYWLSLAMLMLTGAFDNISVVVRHTLVQVLTPDHMRGRVSAVNNVFIGSSNELGGFESGLVARFCGPFVAVVSGGIGTILVVWVVDRVWPAVRGLGSLQHVTLPGAEDDGVADIVADPVAAPVTAG